MRKNLKNSKGIITMKEKEYEKKKEWKKLKNKKNV